MEQPVMFIIQGACSLGPQIALEWADVPYQVGITTPEIRASENFRKINPTGKVGAIKDGNNIVGENLAILLYIADKYPNAQICPPLNTLNRAKVYQWLSYISSTLHVAFSQVLFSARFANGGDVALFKNGAMERLFGVLSYINYSFLSVGYLALDKPTIADAQAYAILRWSKGFKGGESVIDITQFPNITKFLELMEANQGVQNALAIESQKVDSIVNSKFTGYFTF